MKLFQPMGPRLLVKRLDEAAPVSQLIEVVQHNPNPSRYALILAVGKMEQSPELEVGMVVLLKDYSGAPVQIELEDGSPAEECAVIMESDVLGIMEGM